MKTSKEREGKERGQLQHCQSATHERTQAKPGHEKDRLCLGALTPQVEVIVSPLGPVTRADLLWGTRVSQMVAKIGVNRRICMACRFRTTSASRFRPTPATLHGAQCMNRTGAAGPSEKMKELSGAVWSYWSTQPQSASVFPGLTHVVSGSQLDAAKPPARQERQRLSPKGDTEADTRWWPQAHRRYGARRLRRCSPPPRCGRTCRTAGGTPPGWRNRPSPSRSSARSS